MIDHATPSLPRPFWFPQSLDWGDLPREFQIAIQEVVCPLYDELVVQEQDPVARAGGVTLAFLVTVEIAEQCALGEQLPGIGSIAESESFDKRLNRLLLLVGAKSKIQNAIVRWREFKSKQDALGLSYGAIKSLVEQCTTPAIEGGDEWNQDETLAKDYSE